MKVLVMIPSRDRPDELIQAVESVLTTSDADAMPYVDDDQLGLYRDYVHRFGKPMVGPRIGPVAAANAIVAKYPDYDAYGIMTDDARMVVQGWDGWLLETMASFPNQIGVVSPYHNMGGHCDMPYVSRGWINAVGWYACPSCHHYAWPIINGLIGEMSAICHAPKTAFAIHHPHHDRNEGVADHREFFKFVVRELPLAVERVRTAMVVV